jgi:hypothetical protein
VGRVSIAPAYAGLCIVQAVAIVLPGAPVALPEVLRSRAWALVLPGVLVAFVVGLSADPALADRLADLAILTPAIALLAAAVAAPAWRWPVACSSVAAVALGLLLRHGDLGELARAATIACACSVLASLLAGVTMPWALRLGLVALVVLDVVLVATGAVGHTSNALHQAAPPAGLPSFQDATLGRVTMGYGDMFGAAVLGAALVAEGRARGRVAVVVLVSALGFGLLLAVFHTIPATVPLLAGLAVGAQERRSM